MWSQASSKGRGRFSNTAAAKQLYIDWGAFITAVLNFFIIALTLFVILKAAMKSNEFFKKAKLKALSDLEKNKLTKEDKKVLKQRGISRRDKVAVKEYINERNEIIKQQVLEEEAKKKQEEEEKKKNTQEYLLKEIRDLLAKDVKEKVIE